MQPESAMPNSETSASQRLCRYHRLRTRGDFDAVFRGGRFVRRTEMTVRAMPNGLAHARLGLVVGRRHGNAVRRNRMKRLLREAFRRNRHLLSTPCDIVVAPRSGWRDLSLQTIEPSFREALRCVDQAITAG